MPRGAKLGHPKWGGRRPGSKNKRTLAMEAAAFAAAASGETPLDYMLRIMRDPTVEHDRRDDMAKAAAPYLHPRLAAIESKLAVDMSMAERWADALRDDDESGEVAAIEHGGKVNLSIGSRLEAAMSDAE